MEYYAVMKMKEILPFAITWIIHRRTIKKIIKDPDNHDGVITHLDPDILECEVKWALKSITMNKASGCDRIPAETISNPER